MSTLWLDPTTLAAAHFEWRNVEMKISTVFTYLSVAIENFCFSKIVPARLTKTISLTNVQHFGHFFLLQLDTKSTTHSPTTLT